MPHEGRVNVRSRDRPVGVNDERAKSRKRTLTGARARARRIEDDNVALR